MLPVEAGRLTSHHSSPTRRSIMHRTGTGILAIWHDIEPTGHDDFLEWHTREHMPERVSVPGFLRGCRYVALQGSPQYFNFYQTETPDTLVSAAYLERLDNPTPWTQRAVPHFRNLNRSAGRVLGSTGIGEGGVIATLRLSPTEGARESLRTWFLDEALSQVHQQPGIVAVHLWSAERAASLVETSESRARVDAAEVADWTMAIEANAEHFAVAAKDWLCKQTEFRGSLASHANIGVYQLQHRLNTAG